jgi:membrane protease YdiL (CAAX protease family)
MLVAVAVLALLAVRAARKDRREFPRFKRYRSTVRRQRVFRRWLLESLLTFGGGSVVLLLIAGGYVPRLLEAVRSSTPGQWWMSLLDSHGSLILWLAIGTSVLLIVGTILLVHLARDTEEVPTIGDVGAMLPRNRRELGYGLALSLNAGVVEELMFRLAFPAVLFGATGQPLVAIIGGVAVFALLHAYQGVWGVLGSALIGAFLMLLYLASGSILVPIIAHALIDLRSLVLIPVVVYRVHLKPGASKPAS